MTKIKTAPYVKQMIGGKFLSDGYDWSNDPNNYKINNHIPSNRCYHCSFKFVGAEYAAYCVICDKAMNPGAEYLMPKVQNLVEQRIRIPEDITETEYNKKLNPKKADDHPLKAEFVTADNLVWYNVVNAANLIVLISTVVYVIVAGKRLILLEMLERWL